jgi:hypothetical protein
MTALQNRCDTCAKFASNKGATFATMFDFVAMEASHDSMRCSACTERLGPVKSNARPHDGDTSKWEWRATNLSAPFQRT